MPAHRVWQHKVPEGVDWQPLDRIVGKAQATLTHLDIVEIDIRVFRAPARDAVYEDLGIAPGNGIAGPIFDTLIIDDRWAPGPPGYNSRLDITAADRVAAGLEEEAGQVYRVEILFTTVSDGPVWSVHEYTIEPIYSRPE